VRATGFLLNLLLIVLRMDLKWTIGDPREGSALWGESHAEGLKIDVNLLASFELLDGGLSSRDPAKSRKS
jgi:hypothetical protein